MTSVRLIARLDIKGPNLIKGIQLEGLRVIGDPQTHPQNAKSPYSATKMAGSQLAEPQQIKFSPFTIVSQTLTAPDYDTLLLITNMENTQRQNSLDVTNYTRHSSYGSIEEYIAFHHPKQAQYMQYRREWENNIDQKLLFLMFETTSQCNLKCPMCIQSMSYPQTDSMTDETFENVLSQIASMKIPSVCMNLTNEPLLDSKIYDRIRAIAAIATVVDIHMNTNAVKLTKLNAEKILRSGLTRLLIGFDAYSKDVFEKIRVGARYDSVIRNILNFIEMKKDLGAVFPVVRISFVRTSVNEHETNAWLEFWKEKVDYLTIQEYISEARDDSRDYLFPRHHRKENLINFDNFYCQQPFERVGIRGDGMVQPCCQYAPELSLGNVKQTGLSDMWTGKKARDLRQSFIDQTWKNNSICNLCVRALNKGRV